MEDRLAMITDELLWHFWCTFWIIQVVTMVVRPSPSALSSPGQTNPAHSAVLSSHVLQPFVRLGGPQLYLLQFVSVPQLDAKLQMWPHKCWTEGNNHFLDLLAIFLIKQPSMRLAFNAAKEHCWFMFILSSRSPASFLQRCFLISWPLDYPRCRT